MISIKTPREIELMRKAGKIVYETHKHLQEFLKEGITTLELNKIAEEFILKQNAKPSFKGFNGYPYAICVSVNEQVVHGMPSNLKIKKGDIVSIDIGADYEGYHGDSAWSYKIGTLSPEKEYLMENTKKVLLDSLKIIKPGIRLGDISKEIEKNAKEYKLGIVRELVGHGIGNHLHEDPEIPNYFTGSIGPIIKEGMTFAIEPMLTLGSPRVGIEDNGWTVSTLDDSPSAHFEHTIVVTKDGYEILTGE
jgi:methionyl aminopeptidase